ncbi:hypothetical protein LOTGIDRAFT_108839 [Lottia gigantea]|uniref:Potassium channel domain-containing protein n=1 Tax=Lottia gigantea TaxID=225164 RepID=V4B2I8_LOTGI|nr:hypothetical protein LOTGIDRAFT_108839 [Lottia gigantea]ESO82629.1 hypothetical protein LOTGIDRAFT_108839 [Lottia gigantea]
MCWTRVKHVLKVLYSYIRSLIGLLFLLIVYSLIGAFIFRAIEAPYETEQKAIIKKERKEIIEQFVNFTNLPVLNETELRNQLFNLLKDYEEEVYTAYKTGVSLSVTKPKWDFYTALFYCGTVYTTIGYGHIYPSTTLGQIVTIIYAFIGIPLALITLADMGKRFTFGIKFVLAFLSQICKSRCCRKMYFGYEVDTEFNVNFYLALTIVIVYMFLGAFIYTRWEAWTYFEAVYFIFISISTIGFGDIIPAHPKFFLLSSVYVFIGLSLVSMCINVAIVYFTQQIDKAKVNIGRATEMAMERTNKTFSLAKGKMHEMSIKMNNHHHHDHSPDRDHNVHHHSGENGHQKKHNHNIFKVNFKNGHVHGRHRHGRNSI